MLFGEFETGYRHLLGPCEDCWVVRAVGLGWFVGEVDGEAVDDDIVLRWRALVDKPSLASPLRDSGRDATF